MKTAEGSNTLGKNRKKSSARYSWQRTVSEPPLPLAEFSGPGRSLEQSKAKPSETLSRHQQHMLGKRKERTANSSSPNLKNEGDIAAPRSGYTVARQLVLEELDLEIRVRQRLKETVESRIGWATCLQTSLNAVREDQGASVSQQQRVRTLTLIAL